MKRTHIITLITTLIGVLLLGCNGDTVTPETILRPVRFATVSLQGDGQKRVFSGTAKAGIETRLSFRIGGRVEKVAVKVGQKVTQGALIAELDASDLRLQYEQAPAAEQNASTQMKNAKANLDRVRGLFEGNNVALAEYENAKNTFAGSRSTYENNVKATNLQRSQMAYGKLFAPMEGFIGAVNIEVNENVSTGAVVAVLSSESDLEITIGIPESVIAQVKTGMAAQATFSALTSERFDCVVSEVSYAIDTSSFTYPGTVKLTGNTAKVRPGMAAEVSFSFADTNRDGVLVAPPGSVGKDNEGHFLYVVEPQETGFGLVHMRRIRVGRLTGSGFVILDGVAMGERVVIAGINNMSDGLKVRLLL